MNDSFQLPPGWTWHDGIIYRIFGNPKPSDKLAVFDMDATLMLTPTTLVKELANGIDLPVQKPAFPNDYILYAPNIREKFKEEIANGRAIVVCSNQSKLVDNPISYRIFERINRLFKELDTDLVVLLAYVSTSVNCTICCRVQRDFNRKPAPGMLQFYESALNGNVKINRHASFYCGDAAGRTWPRDLAKKLSEHLVGTLKSLDLTKRPYHLLGNDKRLTKNDCIRILSRVTTRQLANKFIKDFSDCDFLFAVNNQMQFYTPEEYFYALPKVDPVVKFDPRSIGSSPMDLGAVDSKLVLLVGPPASGKTFHCLHTFIHHVCLSQNATEKLSLRREAQLKKFMVNVTKTRELLTKGHAVVVDDISNGLRGTRRKYAELAIESQVDITVVFFDVSLEFAIHFNRHRALKMEHQFKYVNQAYIKSYYKNLEPPTQSEGFKLIRVTDDTYPVVHSDISQYHLP